MASSDAILAALRAHPVLALVPADVAIPAVTLDLTTHNAALLEVDLRNPEAFGAYIESVIRKAGAVGAVGRYDEDRVVYRHSKLFGDGDRARSVHLGLDLFVPAGTPLSATLDAIVHSVADNARQGDYGPTVLLEHRLGDIVFHSLYGHLARTSVHSLAPGDHLEAGDVFAHIGCPEENGGWPPHVHVQLVADVGDARGDFPGVAAPGERVRMLAICPDPTALVGLDLHRSGRRP